MSPCHTQGTLPCAWRRGASLPVRLLYSRNQASQVGEAGPSGSSNFPLSALGCNETAKTSSQVSLATFKWSPPQMVSSTNPPSSNIAAVSHGKISQLLKILVKLLYIVRVLMVKLLNQDLATVVIHLEYSRCNARIGYDDTHMQGNVRCLELEN